MILIGTLKHAHFYSCKLNYFYILNWTVCSVIWCPFKRSAKIHVPWNVFTFAVHNRSIISRESPRKSACLNKCELLDEWLESKAPRWFTLYPSMHLIYSLSLSRPFPSRSDRTVVVRLQAAMGAEGVRRRANVTRPLGPHLEARHCPLQQVSRCRHACALVIRCETELQKSIRIYELFRNSWGSENLIHHLYYLRAGWRYSSFRSQFCTFH